jgi:hypothetical protein
MDEIIKSKQYQSAVEIDQRIKTTAKALAENLFDLCGLFYRMSSEKLYKELGYQNFADYCEGEVGITKMQGTKYARIGESFIGEKVKSTLPFESLGTEKLYLLARLDEPEREEIQQTVNLEDVSVRELKAEIARLKEEKQKADKAAADANQQRIAMQSDLLSAKSKNRSLSHELEEAKKMSGDAKGLAARLKAAERELSIADQDNYNKLEAQRIEYQKKINALQKQLDDAGKMREVAVETVPDYEAVFRAYYHAAVMAIKEMMTFLQSLDKGTSYQGKCFDLADDLADAMSDALYDKKTGIEKIYAEEGIL